MSKPGVFLHELVGSLAQGAVGNPTGTMIEADAAVMRYALENALGL